MKEWALLHPWMTLFLAYVAMNGIVRAWLIVVRSINICKNGWPPGYCDADGDPVDTRKED